MRVITPIAGLHLASGQVARLAGAAGTVVESRRGLVWITQDGDLDDRVLEAGQSWTVPGSTDVVVSALRGEATVTLRPEAGDARTAGEAAPRRLRQWFTSRTGSAGRPRP